MNDERMALRTTDDGSLDDVVVRDVSMFRAELIDADRLWLCCYLPGTGAEHDRVAFNVSVRDGNLSFAVVEMPTGSVMLEA